jgi:hypothetical protein
MLTVERAGIDTWRPTWYVGAGTRADRALRAMCNVRSRRGALFPEPVQGHRIGYVEGAGLMWAEGHPGGDRLGTAEELAEVTWRLEQELWDRGVRIEPRPTKSRMGGNLVRHHNCTRPGFAGVGRLDLTSDIRCETPEEGIALLAGVHALGLPRAKTFAYHAQGTGNRPLETVAFHGASGGRLLARWYDKGVEANVAARGTFIRAEDQRRYTRATRRAVEDVTTAYVRERYRDRFRPMWQASGGVTVGGPKVLGSKMATLIEQGEVTERRAEQLAGFLLLDQCGVELGSERTRRRRRAAVRDLGLVHADGVFQEVEVDLGAVMEQLMDTAPWERQG